MPRGALQEGGVFAWSALFRQVLVHGAVTLLLVSTVVYLHTRELTGMAGAALYLAAAWAFFSGFALSHIIHEWGHFLGAAISGSAFTIKPRVHPLFFDFDYVANRPGQFLALSTGGLLGNIALFFALLFLNIPNSLVLTALLAAVIGQLVYVLILELPISLGVLAGKQPLDVLAAHFGQGKPLFIRATVGGVVAATLAFLLV